MSSSTTPNSFDSNIYFIDSMAIASPGVGNDWSGNSPNRVQSEILHFHVTLATDANAADRYVHFYLGLLSESPSMGFTIEAATASTLHHINFMQGITPYYNSSEGRHFIPIPPGILLDDSNSLNIQLINKQAGDQLSDLNVIFKIWPSV